MQDKMPSFKCAAGTQSPVPSARLSVWAPVGSDPVILLTTAAVTLFTTVTWYNSLGPVAGLLLTAVVGCIVRAWMPRRQHETQVSSNETETSASW